VAQIGSAKRILVTGASGFAGRTLIPELAAAGFEVHATSRKPGFAPGAARYIVCDLLDGSLDPLLEGMDAVVHLAARAHVMREHADNPESAFMHANSGLTRQLAMAAVRARVGHFVFSSSIKVIGEATNSRPYTEGDPSNPADAYARSKHAAEQALEEIARKSSLSVTILRPPLMYGPGVKGNLLRLMRLLDRGIPLPFASIRNERSLLGLRNFASAIAISLKTPALGHRTFLVTDGPPISTPDLILSISETLGRKPRLFSIPKALLTLGSRAVGLGGEVDRLTNSLIVDDRRIRETLGWSPSCSFRDGLRQMVQFYRESANSAC